MNVSYKNVDISTDVTKVEVSIKKERGDKNDFLSKLALFETRLRDSIERIKNYRVKFFNPFSKR